VDVRAVSDVSGVERAACCEACEWRGGCSVFYPLSLCRRGRRPTCQNDKTKSSSAFFTALRARRRRQGGRHLPNRGAGRVVVGDAPRAAMLDDAVTQADCPAPWWAAPAHPITTGGAIVAVGTLPSTGTITDGGTESSSGAFGCDVRGARGQRRRGNPPLTALPSEAAAPQTCFDAKGLYEALAASPRVCVAFTAAWCAPCVR
jgi:hypothetical protein